MSAATRFEELRLGFAEPPLIKYDSVRIHLMSDLAGEFR